MGAYAEAADSRRFQARLDDGMTSASLTPPSGVIWHGVHVHSEHRLPAGDALPKDLCRPESTVLCDYLGLELGRHAGWASIMRSTSSAARKPAREAGPSGGWHHRQSECEKR